MGDQAVRVLMYLLCLAAILSGPLLRQAEAAGDHARALATLLNPEGSLVTPDGGVGDDSGESTLKTGRSIDFGSLLIPYWDRLAEINCLPPYSIPIVTPFAPGSPQRLPARVSSLPDSSNRRQAWLQLLLI
jgi:hypothetical protein